MNPYRVLAAVAADWGRLGPYLRMGMEGTDGTAGAGDAAGGPNGLSSALRSLRSMERHAPGRTEAAGETARFVLALLPPAEAERLVATHSGRLAGTLEDGTLTEETYAGFTAADLAFLLLDDNPMVGPLLGPVRERLLSYPMLDDWAAEAHGRTPGLIRLRGESGSRGVDRIPSFQFSDAATPWPVVVTVNGLLDAARDPWGAADWWLSANGYLGVAPAELLGNGQDGQLIGTARYLVEGE
ncbi:hypothetical protein OIE62_23500 [Streptomyces scopuliridis]|uniref:Uncharacterized protein n=1 Tax=Streptomyces scopuliridis TaxID=452529 RepID=A0ACD4ZLH1_9ACTN|nr:hypothetical protein [Streptomyces scopuliridis]WSB34362.1 hypothetical protein OG949_16775 [Streptomyces scopuliridis]WSB98632.1 hypothetical protein OG835_17445 [Streptomyces scopuliridis]WSC07665.1 hypothetical protein OIE62_23500 [Streptomyces scopuliridis]